MTEHSVNQVDRLPGIYVFGEDGKCRGHLSVRQAPFIQTPEDKYPVRVVSFYDRGTMPLAWVISSSKAFPGLRNDLNRSDFERGVIANLNLASVGKRDAH